MRALAFASIAVLAVTTIMSASAADAPDKVQAPVAAEHTAPKTKGKVEATKVPDPNAGTDDMGKPAPAVTNGGQMATH